MKTFFDLNLRRFTVQIKDNRTGEIQEDTITLSKQQLQAAQLCGQSSKELIQRLYNRAGYFVLDISKAEKRTVELDLKGLYEV